MPPSIKNDFIIKHFISKLLTNAWFQYTVHCIMSLWTHIFNSPKSLSFKPQYFLCAATLHEAIIHLLCMFKEHNKNRKFEVSFTSFIKKKLHPYYRHLIMQFLCINANFITSKVTVLYIYVAFPHVSLGVLQCMHAWHSVRVCNCLMKCINFMKIKFDTKLNKGIPMYY